MNVHDYVYAMENVRIRTDNNHTVVKNGTKYYPLYIVLYANKSILGDTIRKVTNEPFSHVSISFDTGLNDIFSFGISPIKGKVEGSSALYNGAVREAFKIRPGRFRYQSFIKYGLYVIFLTEDQMDRVKAKVRSVFNNREDYRFSIGGLVKYALGQESHSETKMFCSQFVSWMLSVGDVKLNRDPSRYSPYAITKLDGIMHIEDGLIGNFDRKLVDQRMDEICKEFKAMH